jgi:hypothetical protein
MTFTSYDAATDTIERASGLLRAARPNSSRRRSSGELFTRPSTVPSHVRSDMRRLSIVTAVAALDTYMHRLILERAFQHDDLPKSLAALDVPFEQLLAQADATRDAARAKPSKSRPRVGVKRQLQERLLRETFQNYNAVSRALKMAGRAKDWGPIGAKMAPPLTPAEIKRRLDEVVHRRNQIVHEGDYERLQKPQKAKLNKITQPQARRDIDFIAAVIDAIHAVVS